MSEQAKKYRAEMRAKANRLGSSKSPDKVDASSWSPGKPMNADKKTGARPIRAKTYKFGGAIQGDRAPRNAGKEPRADGGKVEKDGGGALTIHDTATENKKKLGSFHDGGYKKGGRTEKCGGGPMADGGKAEIKSDRLKNLGKYAHGGEVEKPLAKGGKVDDKADMKGKGIQGVALPKKDTVGESWAAYSEAHNARARKKYDKDGNRKGYRESGLDFEGRPIKKADGGSAKASEDAVRDRYANMPTAKIKTYIVNMIAKEPDKRPQDWRKHFEAGNAEIEKREGSSLSLPKRSERARGGRAKSGKGKTNINIIIGAPATGQAASSLPPPGAPVRPPPPPMNAPPPPMMGPGGPPPGPPPGMPPGPPGPPPGMPPGGPLGPDDLPPGMPRARGGRTGYMSKDAGAGSGLGRLRKVHKEGQHTPGFKA